MHCTSCGTSILPGMMHCPNCGTPTTYKTQVQQGIESDQTMAAMNFGSFQEAAPIPPTQGQNTPPPITQLAFPASPAPTAPPPPNFYNPEVPQGNQPPNFYNAGIQQRTPAANPYNMGTQQAAPYANPAPAANPPYGFNTGTNQTSQIGQSVQNRQAAQYLPSQFPQQPQQYPPLLPPVLPQTPLPPRKQRRLSRGLTITVAILVLLILVGSGIIYYFTVPYPAQIHAQATATAQTNLNNQATGTAQSIHDANATVTAVAQATYTAQQNIYNQATTGSPTFTDALAQNGSLRWDQYDSSNSGGCIYTGGSYHVKELQNGYFQPCTAQASNLSNFTLQVQMTILSGNYGGIVFRSDPVSSKFYLLQMSTDGSYDLYAYINNNGNDAKTLLSSTTSTMKGLNQSNLLTLIARGSQLTLFINKQYVDAINDSTYSSGQIGFMAYYKTNPTEVSFSNLQVWKL